MEAMVEWKIVESCGGGVGVGGGGDARVEVEDVGQWNMMGRGGGYTENTGSINMQWVCLRNPGKDLHLHRH
jgi:hypothetical protein